MREYEELVEIIEDKSEIEKYMNTMKKLMCKLEEQYPKLFNETIVDLEDIAYSMDIEQARHIVRNMRPFGEHWNIEQIKDLLYTKGIVGECIHYYLVMNMVYNDYHEVASNFGHRDDVEFFFELSHAFINDEDGKPHKVERYFL